MRLMYVLFICLTTAIVLLLVALVIPDEQAPRTVVLANGGSSYVFQSFKKAVLWPLGWGLFFLLAAGTAPLFFRERHMEMAADGSGVGRGVGILVISPFAFILVWALLINPYNCFRKVTVEEHAIVFTSLYHSWALLRSDVRTVQVVREDEKQGGVRYVNLMLVVATNDGREFRSVKIEGLTPAEPRYREYLNAFGSLTKEIVSGQRK